MMRTSRIAVRLAAAAGLLAAALVAPAQAATGEQGAADLSNKSCLSCHGDKQKKIETADAKGEKRPLR